MAMTTASRKHQAACEDAGGLSCDCGCGGPGHRKAILERCLRAAGPADPSFTSVANHLEDIYGVFHTDPSTDQRRYQRGRATTTYSPPPSLTGMSTGAKATRFETVVLDDGVHEILLKVATSPNTATLLPFVRVVTTDAIGPMTAAIAVTGGLGNRTPDSHLWCSLVTEALWMHSRGVCSTSWPDFAGIGYPRRGTLEHPHAWTPLVRTTGRAHLLRALNSFFLSGTAPSHIRFALQLVAITSCTDVWQHPAVVRYAMTPQLPPWRPAKHLAMANYQTHLREVQSRWASRGNW